MSTLSFIHKFTVVSQKAKVKVTQLEMGWQSCAVWRVPV